MKKPKPFHEDFANFFEKPTRETLRTVLENNIGEFRNCDYKEDWPDKSSLSKHILAIANTSGGAIIVGVKEKNDKTLDAVGLQNLKDKADITKGIKKFLPSRLLEAVDIVDFSYSTSEYKKLKGKSFQVLFVSSDPKYLPYLAKSDGQNIKSNMVYIRREGESDEATHDDVQNLLNIRIETGYSSSKELSLDEHLSQLQILYKQIKKSNEIFGGVSCLNSRMQKMMDQSMGIRKIQNPHYPKESFDEFISKLIKSKKKRIAEELGVELN